LHRHVHAEARIAALGVTLPPPNKPAGNYVACVREGNTLYLSGHLPWVPGKEYQGPEYLVKGKVGANVSLEEGYAAAKSVALCLLGTLKGEVGDLDKVKILKLFGIVNCIEGFADQPKVVNGASDFLVAVLGEQGKHARSAIGTHALPLNVPVEIEMIAQIVE